MHGGWKLSSLSMFTKRYGGATGIIKKAVQAAFRTTFNECIFAVVNEESENTYTALFNGFIKCFSI